MEDMTPRSLILGALTALDTTEPIRRTRNRAAQTPASNVNPRTAGVSSRLLTRSATKRQRRHVSMATPLDDMTPKTLIGGLLDATSISKSAAAGLHKRKSKLVKSPLPAPSLAKKRRQTIGDNATPRTVIESFLREAPDETPVEVRYTDSTIQQSQPLPNANMLASHKDVTSSALLTPATSGHEAITASFQAVEERSRYGTESDKQTQPEGPQSVFVDHENQDMKIIESQQDEQLSSAASIALGFELSEDTDSIIEDNQLISDVIGALQSPEAKSRDQQTPSEGLEQFTDHKTPSERLSNAEGSEEYIDHETPSELLPDAEGSEEGASSSEMQPNAEGLDQFTDHETPSERLSNEEGSQEYIDQETPSELLPDAEGSELYGPSYVSQEQQTEVDSSHPAESRDISHPSRWRDLVTPKLPPAAQKKTLTDLQNRRIEKSAVKKPVKGPNTSKKSASRNTPGSSSGLPSSLVKGIFQHFSSARVSKSALAAVEQGSKVFFKQISSDLMAYSNHAGRQTIELSDVELLMKRQGLVTSKQSLNSLIEKYLPLEYRQELIPVVQSGNRLVLK